MTATNKDELFGTFYQPTTAKVAVIASGAYLQKSYAQLTGSGYVIESLESALWCFHNSTTFKEAILLAANIGNDADTTAAICGQVAGAFYGAQAIPDSWIAALFEGKNIAALATKLLG